MNAREGRPFPQGWTVWITGASSGIGAALAVECARGGATVLVLSGRSRERLTAVAERCRSLPGNESARIEVLPFDAGDPGQRNDALRELARRDIAVDALINNAGISQRGLAADTHFSVDRDIMEVDYLCGVELTKAVLPGMLQRKRGLLVAVSSVAALIPAPLRSGYNAAKAAQVAFFGTLKNELAAAEATFPVKVALVIPGFVRTDISRNALDGSGGSWGQMDRNQASGITADRAARDIMKGIRRGASVVMTGVPTHLRLALLLRRLVPGVLDRMLQKVKVT